MSYTLEKETLWSTVSNAVDIFRRTSNTSLPWWHNLIFYLYQAYFFYYLLNHYRAFTDILFRVLLYYILFVQRLWMALASKGTLLNIHCYYYSVLCQFFVCTLSWFTNGYYLISATGWYKSPYDAEIYPSSTCKALLIMVHSLDHIGYKGNWLQLCWYYFLHPFTILSTSLYSLYNITVTWK